MMDVAFSYSGKHSINVFDLDAHDVIATVSSYDIEYKYSFGDNGHIGMYLARKDRIEQLVICRLGTTCIVEAAMPVLFGANKNTVKPRPIAVLGSIAHQFGVPFQLTKSTTKLVFEQALPEGLLFDVRGIRQRDVASLSAIDETNININISTLSRAECYQQTIGLACCIQGGQYKAWLAECKKCAGCGAKPRNGERFCKDCGRAVVNELKSVGYLKTPPKQGPRGFKSSDAMENIHETKHGRDE